MFARLQPSILQRCPLQSIESSLQSTCALLQAANGGAATFSTARPSSSDGPNARTNRPSSGPGAQSQRPPRDSQGPKKLQRREFDRPQQFGGASAGDNSGNRQGQRGPKRTPGGGQRRPWQKGGAGGGGGGGGNLLDAALGTVRGTPPTTGPAALLQGIAPKAINTDLLPIADYIIRDNDLARAKEGRMSGEEHRSLVNRLQTILVRSPEKMNRMLETDMRLESDPNYRIEDAFTAGPSTEAASPEETLEANKAQLCAMLGLSAEEFEQYKSVAAAEFRETMLPELEAKDPRVQEKELEKLLDGITPAHAHYGAVVSKLRVLQNNPNWPYDKKAIFVRRMVRNLA